MARKRGPAASDDGGDERKRDANRKREGRADGKDVVVPSCADRERRELLESDDEEWLLYYFAPESGTRDAFTYAFVPQQKLMIAAIRNAIAKGEDEAMAATRGEGKTLYCERLLLKYTLQGVITFSVLFAATGGNAEDSLDSIKTELETNDRLAEDYPEACTPVRALENTPNRAHYQTVTGKRHDNGQPFEKSPSKFSWCGQEIFFPKVPGSPSSGAIIATRGLDAAVRGLRKRGRRPDIVVIDDPDTEETAVSEDQAKKLEKRIDRAIAGLGSQKKRVARVMLTTLQSRVSVSWKFTNPADKPSWHGKRFRFLITAPSRADLWDEFVQLQQDDWRNGTSLGHDLYAAKRTEMDAGASVANPNRKDPEHLSALEFYYTQVARIGQEAVDTEYDNNPPEESGPIESGITANRIIKQLNGFDRKIVPPGCTVITQGIDCRKVALHWVVRAWRTDGIGYHTIDYGIKEVLGATDTDAGLDTALRRAIKSRMDDLKEEGGYALPDGELLPVHFTVVDSGWRTHAVYSACRDIGVGIMPGKGCGKSAGCAQPSFSPCVARTETRIPGDGWFMSKQDDDGTWLVMMDTDRWKAWEHDRWMTDPGNPGCMYLFGEPNKSKNGRMSAAEKGHFSYSKHVTAEVEIEDVIKGALVRKWKSKSDTNHYLDASYMASVAANIKGIRLARSLPSPLPHRPAAKPALIHEHQDLGQSYLVSNR